MDEKNPEFYDLQLLLRILRGLLDPLYLICRLNGRHLRIQQEAGCGWHCDGDPESINHRVWCDPHPLLLFNL